MDDFFKNLKKKLSVDNIVGFMKDTKVIDEKTIKEEDVRRTLSKVDPNNIVDVDEVAASLKEISQQSQSAINDLKNKSGKMLDTAKSGLNVLKKTDEEEEPQIEDPWRMKEDDVFVFYD